MHGTIIVMDVDIIIIGVLSITFIMLIVLRTHVSLMILSRLRWVRSELIVVSDIVFVAC